MKLSASAHLVIWLIFFHLNFRLLEWRGESYSLKSAIISLSPFFYLFAKFVLLHRSCSSFAFCCVFLPPMSLARILPLVCIQGKHRMMQQLNAQDEAFVNMSHLPDNGIWITTPTDLEETALTQFSLFREFVCSLGVLFVSQHGQKCSLVYTT